jgi:alkaline phosphatase
MIHRNTLVAATVASILAIGTNSVNADPVISRLTPPSQFFATGGTQSAPMIARFIQGQRFDLQATVRPDAGRTITDVKWTIDGKTYTPAAGTTSLVPATALTATDPNAKVASVRGYSNLRAKVHTFTATATQDNGLTVSATGEFEIVSSPLTAPDRVKNVIIMLGDGMGASQRTAARIMLNGYSQGKVNTKLAMDTFPNTAMIMTASLNTIVTDSAPGMQNYVTGNKAANNQEGVCRMILPTNSITRVLNTCQSIWPVSKAKNWVLSRRLTYLMPHRLPWLSTRRTVAQVPVSSISFWMTQPIPGLLC